MKSYRTTPRTQAGLTLVELLVSMTILLMVVAGMVVVLQTNRTVFLKSETRIDIQQTARLTIGEMARQIRMAGFFPENFASTPPTPPLTNAVHVATDQAVAVFGDIDATGTSEVYLFCLDGNVIRRARTASGSAAAYTCANGEIVAENVTALRIAYHDDAGASLPATPNAPYQLDSQGLGSIPDFTTVTQRSAVRRIVISLSVSEQTPGHGYEIYTLSSDVRLRNVY